MEGKMPENVKKTILLVEDEMILALTQRKQLESYGYAVQAVNTGEKAVAAAKTSPEIDLILMDINLPGISGLETLKRLRLDPTTAAIPVMAISANAMPLAIETCLAAGFFCYLTQPIDIKELMETIDQALEQADSDQLRPRIWSEAP